MTPQAPFMILAPVRDGAVEALRADLAGFTQADKPGLAEPCHSDLPFADFPRLHFARALILDDPTLADRALAYPRLAWPDERVLFAVLGVCDGDAGVLLRDLARHAAPGLTRLFAHCDGWVAGGELLSWLRDHRVEPATNYVNWIGRTVTQVHEEAALHARLRDASTGLSGPPATQAAVLKARVRADPPVLTPAAPTPARWRAFDLVSLVSLPLFVTVILFWAPLLWWLSLPLAAAFVVLLRRKERRDPVVVPPFDTDAIRARSAYEDHDVTNPFSAIGSLKPGRFRRWLVIVILWGVDWTTRHIYTRGRLARVGTIHFARWVLIDEGRRLFFASDYDGPLDTYMDDFINKVAFGLNAVFSNGLGYPRTDWLVVGGASDELQFKRFLRHHQLVTQLWYKAYPGLTTYDLARNARLRQGYEAAALDDDAARAWLAEL